MCNAEDERDTLADDAHVLRRVGTRCPVTTDWYSPCMGSLAVYGEEDVTKA
ncbi:hypothetical protein SAMN04488556_3386 [Halostagnicola kamekurae]|uniref:Uncharacterized protein n=1 Tax=Halostagnicola kamekurae TaxID=619731 RepID=A0A1I6TS96_9EURY|nr:hypothetical protein SAMN04488556_3386 [Halostagnicola kamekurae]